MKQKVLLFEIRLEILFLTFRMQHRAPMVLGACDDGILHFRVLLQGDIARTRKPGEKLKNVFRSHSVSSSSEFRTTFYPQLAPSLILVNQWHQIGYKCLRSKIQHQSPKIQDQTLASRNRRSDTSVQNTKSATTLQNLNQDASVQNPKLDTSVH